MFYFIELTSSAGPFTTKVSDPNRNRSSEQMGLIPHFTRFLCRVHRPGPVRSINLSSERARAHRVNGSEHIQKKNKKIKRIVGRDMRAHGKRIPIQRKIYTWRGRRDWRRCKSTWGRCWGQANRSSCWIFSYSHSFFLLRTSRNYHVLFFIFYFYSCNRVFHFWIERPHFCNTFMVLRLSTTSWSRTSNATFISFMHFERLGSYIHVLKYISAPSIEPCHSVRSLSPVSSSLIADN